MNVLSADLDATLTARCDNFCTQGLDAVNDTSDVSACQTGCANSPQPADQAACVTECDRRCTKFFPNSPVSMWILCDDVFLFLSLCVQHAPPIAMKVALDNWNVCVLSVPNRSHPPQKNQWFWLQ